MTPRTGSTKLTARQRDVLLAVVTEAETQGPERRIDIPAAAMQELFDLGYLGVSITQRGRAALARQEMRDE